MKGAAGTLMVLFLAWIGAGLGYAADLSAGEAKAAPCIVCHPASGHHSDPGMPGLAGQQAQYTVSQLKAYKDKTRTHMIMNSLAARLTDADMENIAAYYAGLEPMSSEGDETLNAAGKSKYTLCVKCHGEDGSGKGISPRLAGQQAEYTLKELKAFKDGTRKNPPMNALAGALSDADMKALSVYLAGLK